MAETKDKIVTLEGLKAVYDDVIKGAFVKNGALATGADLNEITGVGTWHITTGNATQLVNAPAGLSKEGLLVCFASGAHDVSSRYDAQIIITPEQTSVNAFNDAYVRYRVGNGWDNWTRIMTSRNSLRWYGKSCRCIGDSLTAGAYTSGAGWVTHLADICGFATVINDGKSGTALQTGIETEDGVDTSIYTRAMALTEADATDVIIIAGGVNDVLRGGYLGTPDSTDTGTIYGAMDSLIRGLLAKFPATKLFVVTPYKYNLPDGVFSFVSRNSNMPNEHGFTAKDAVKAIVEVANRYCVPVIDVFNGAGISPFIPECVPLYYSGQNGGHDGLHYNADGHAEIAKIIGAFVNNPVTTYGCNDATTALENELIRTNRIVDALVQAGKGITHRFETEETDAYTATVPTGSLLATPQMVGGKSVVWNQLNESNMDLFSSSGVTFRRNENGGYTVTGTLTERRYIYTNAVSSTAPWRAKRIKVVPGHKMYIYYTGQVKTEGIISFYSEDATWLSGFTKTAIYTVQDNASYATGCGIDCPNNMVGEEFNETVYTSLHDLTLMFGAGNEPTDTTDPRIAWIEQYAAKHPDYNAGEIVSADVSEIQSVGKNLFNIRNSTIARCYIQDGVSVVGAVADNRSIWFPIEGGYTYTISKTLSSNAMRVAFAKELPVINVTNIATVYYARSEGALQLTATAESDDKYIIIQLFANNDTHPDASYYIDGLMVEKSASATPYEPYHSESHAIPSAIRSLPGYGWSAGAVYNYVDFENKKYVQRVAAVDMGSRNWSRTTETSPIVSGGTQIGMKVVANNNTVANIICAKYPTVARSVQKDKTIALNTSNNICIVDADFVDADSFKASLSGVMLYYELAEPIVTDISGLLPEDIIIPVESGGTLTWENEAMLPVPAKTEYLIKLSEVL